MATKSSPSPGTKQASGQLNLVFQAPKAQKAAGNIHSPQIDEIIEEMTPPKSTPKSKSERNGKKSSPKRGITAETMAKQQREISVSEFFAKNRHLLGFDNKRKALLTTVKEAIDNSLDACEEGGILPDIDIVVKQVDQDRYRVTIRDNGPGIVKAQIPNVFGKLLYGSKFHRLKMSRGQQGIGISAAGMYGLITTGKPIHIISRTGPRADAHDYTIAIDTKKNNPDIIKDKTVEVDWPHGTQVSIELEAGYNKGRQSVDEYLELTAIANPHARFVYHPPVGPTVEFPRGTETLPDEPLEIKPHPYGIELGTFIKMLQEAKVTNLGGLLTQEFSRVSSGVAKKVCLAAGVTPKTRVSGVSTQIAEKIYSELQATKLMAPSTNCLSPMGAEAILAGLLKGVKAEFYTASTRPPSVYRGNPFQIEVGLAYGGDLGKDHRDEAEKNTGGSSAARLIRFANRVPLLYQQSSCALFKAVTQTKWNNYGLSQPGGGMPHGPIVIFIHMASVWVPFISEGKEAVADYDEIRKDVKLGIAECGRRLSLLLKRKRKKAAYTKRRDVFTRYIDEVVNATRAVTVINKESFRSDLIELSKKFTAQADMEFDDHGKVIKKQLPGNDMGLEDTVVVDREGDVPDPTTLFEMDETSKSKKPPAKTKPKAKKKKKRKK